MKNSLKKRMYFLVVSSLCGISKGIMCGHAALRYARTYADKDNSVWDFVDNHETWIILNGGTTNKTQIPETGLYEGSMDNYLGELCAFIVDNPNDKIDFEYFFEPNLNNALTAICLIVDERVFNREEYPDFYDWVKEQEVFVRADDTKNWKILEDKFEEEIGKDIFFLKKLLNNKKLA